MINDERAKLESSEITTIIYKPVTNVSDWYQASLKAKRDQLPT